MSQAKDAAPTEPPAATNEESKKPEGAEGEEDEAEEEVKKDPIRDYKPPTYHYVRIMVSHTLKHVTVL